jgi:hypothetical protein
MCICVVNSVQLIVICVYMICIFVFAYYVVMLNVAVSCVLSLCFIIIVHCFVTCSESSVTHLFQMFPYMYGCFMVPVYELIFTHHTQQRRHVFPFYTKTCLPVQQHIFYVQQEDMYELTALVKKTAVKNISHLCLKSRPMQK